MRPIDFCHPSRLLRALTSRGFPVCHRPFRDGLLVDGPVALLALPDPNPTSPGDNSVSRRYDRFGGSLGVGPEGVLCSPHTEWSNLWHSCRRSPCPAGSWLSPFPNETAPNALTRAGLREPPRPLPPRSPWRERCFPGPKCLPSASALRGIAPLRERSVWALVGGVDVSCSTFFAATHRLTTLVHPHAAVETPFDVHAFRRHRLVRAGSPATIADPPWLVRSPAPASLDQNAAYRNLQHDTTREHDSPLKFDPRPSRVAFCCAPFAFAARSATLRYRRLPKAVLRRPSAQQRVTKTLRSPRAG